MFKSLWQVQDASGSWHTHSQEKSWLNLPEPIQRVIIMGYPLEGMDFYFFVIHAMANMRQSFITGITFGGIKNGIVKEWKADSKGLIIQEYSENKFPFTKSILKKGI